ncbi:TenA family protein [Secundilactobacillus silagei]|uniref:TenA family protein n=1 Tax=Secundilactobacillus silagei TaxID=1293415 RepID=UPI000AD5FBDD|nr:TenA family protein [Secundilactobacillus silagei]
MSFSTELIEAGTPILDHIMEHPFVKGIGAGQLSKEALMFYVTQDFNYLNEFLHADAVALLKSTSREDMQIIDNQLDFLLSSESEAHKNFCEVAGTSYKSLQGQPMAPTTKLYTNHMLETLKAGDLIDIIAAMTPCPWTYAEIGKKLVEQGKNTPDNVFTLGSNCMLIRLTKIRVRRQNSCHSLRFWTVKHQNTVGSGSTRPNAASSKAVNLSGISGNRPIIKRTGSFCLVLSCQ